MRAPPVCGSCPARRSRARGGLGLRPARRALCTGFPARRVAAVRRGPALPGQVWRLGVSYLPGLGLSGGRGWRWEERAGPGLGAGLRKWYPLAAPQDLAPDPLLVVVGGAS